MTQKRSLLSETVFTQIEAFIQRNGGDHDGFVVGVTADVETALTAHNINRARHPHFKVNAVTEDRAANVVRQFKKLGCTIGEHQPSGFVYCYRRAFDTNP